MMKFGFRSFAALLCFVALSGTAWAQSPKVLRALRANYDVVWPAQCGLIRVNKGGQRIPDSKAESNGKYGYVDTLGQIVVPPTYDHAVDFSEGFAVVGMRDEARKMRSGLIDRTGRVVAPLEWEHLGDVRCGVGVAYCGDGDERVFSLVDTLGNVRRLGFDYCQWFTRGRALVGTGSYVLLEKVPGINRPDRYEFRGKFGFIRPDGELAIPVHYDDARGFSDDGLAAVGRQGKYYVKWGFIDVSGAQVIPCDFYSVEPFRHNRAVVSRVVASGKLAYGFIDRSGKEVIPCKFDMASGFRFPNTWVGMKGDDGYAYALVDSVGQAVLPFAVTDLQDNGKFGQAVAAIVDAKDGRLRYGIVDNSGSILLPFEYDQITIYTQWDDETNRWQESAMGVKDGQNFSFDISRRGE